MMNMRESKIRNDQAKWERSVSMHEKLRSLLSGPFVSDAFKAFAARRIGEIEQDYPFLVEQKGD